MPVIPDGTTGIQGKFHEQPDVFLCVAVGKVNKVAVTFPVT
jgi:hypothetical protein